MAKTSGNGRNGGSVGIGGALPSLEGSEKQVNWAESLRERAVNKYKSLIDGANFDPLRKEARAAITPIIANGLKNTTSATFYINNRNSNASTINGLLKTGMNTATQKQKERLNSSLNKLGNFFGSRTRLNEWIVDGG
jgi:hypothetical protein